MKYFFAMLCFGLFTMSSSSFADKVETKKSRAPSAEDCTGKIKSASSCFEASAQFLVCATGNVYDLTEPSEAVVEKCEVSIKSYPELAKSYKSASKFCETKGASRQDVAFSQQCQRELSMGFGKAADLKH